MGRNGGSSVGEVRSQPGPALCRSGDRRVSFRNRIDERARRPDDGVCLRKLRLPGARFHGSRSRGIAKIDFSSHKKVTKNKENQMERAGATTLMGNPMTLVGPELKAGDKAPEFAALDNGLKPVHLSDTGHKTRIFSVVPSLDTPVCDAQTKRFNEEAGKLPDVSIYTISMDLPFAQKRWCGTYGVDHVKMVSDHKSGSFGENYGTLIKDLRILSRAIFVVDKNNNLRYVEYVL